LGLGAKRKMRVCMTPNYSRQRVDETEFASAIK
jgi:hypothetical protein